MYTEGGVLSFITAEYLQKINSSFDKHICQYCGAEQEDENTNRAEGFL